MKIEVVARRVLGAAYMRYSHCLWMMSFLEYEEACKRLALRWHTLSDLHQWQLRSREECSRADGRHFRVTRSAVEAAHRWAEEQGHAGLKHPKEWTTGEAHVVDYVLARQN